MLEGTYDTPPMNLGPIKEVLGENVPEITPTPLGRLRLVSALINKFGQNYRNIPPARKALDHFDSEHDYFRKLRRIQGGY
jgi:hypothetical protein